MAKRKRKRDMYFPRRKRTQAKPSENQDPPSVLAGAMAPAMALELPKEEPRHDNIETLETQPSPIAVKPLLELAPKKQQDNQMAPLDSKSPIDKEVKHDTPAHEARDAHAKSSGSRNSSSSSGSGINVSSESSSNGSSENNGSSSSSSDLEAYEWLKQFYMRLSRHYNSKGWWGMEDIIQDIIVKTVTCRRCKKQSTIENQWAMHPCFDYIGPFQCECKATRYPNELSDTFSTPKQKDLIDQRLWRFLRWTEVSFGNPLQRLLLLVQRLVYSSYCDDQDAKDQFYAWMLARRERISVYFDVENKETKKKRLIRHALPWTAPFSHVFQVLEQEHGARVVHCAVGPNAVQPEQTLLSTSVFSHPTCRIAVTMEYNKN